MAGVKGQGHKREDCGTVQTEETKETGEQNVPHGSGPDPFTI